MKKKIQTLITSFAALICFFAVNSAYSQAPTVTINFNTTGLVPGSTVHVPVVMNGTQVGHWSLLIHYNTSALTYLGTTANVPPPTGFFSAAGNFAGIPLFSPPETLFKASFIYLGGDPGATYTNQTIFTINFTYVGGNTDIYFKYISTGSSGNNVTYVMANPYNVVNTGTQFNNPFLVGSISADQTICYNTAPVQLNGVPPTGGATPYSYQWQSSTDNISFNDISGATSLNYTPGTLITKTYYRQKQYSSDMQGFRTTNVITVTINPLPVAPTSINATANPICSGTSTTLSVVGGSGTNINWYTGSGPCGGVFVSSGNTLTVTLALTTTYWANWNNSCGASECASITITVNNSPIAPTSPVASPSTICSENSIRLSATITGDGTLTWYSGSCGGTFVETGNNSIVTPGITSGTITYYARMEKPPCNPSSCVSVTVTVNPSNVIPSSASATPNPVLLGSSTTLHATGGSGTTLHWYTSSYGANSAGTGNDLVITPSNNITYYARWENTTCPASGCASVDVVVQSFTISGVVQYANLYLTPLNGVFIKLYKDGVYTGASTYSAAQFVGGVSTQGYYQFTGLLPGNYSLVVSYDGTWGGVNATDALVIELYTCCGYSLPGLLWNAGDVDANAVVNGTDALWVKYRTVSLADSFPAGDWVFNNGLITVAGNTSNNINGLCTGDVNFSYIPTGFKSQSFISVVDDGTRYISTGQSFNYEIKPTINTEIGAMTLFLGYDQGLVDIENVKSSIGEMQYNLSDNGKISLAWSATNPVTTNESNPIITLRMKAKELIPEPILLFTIGGESEFANANAEQINDLDLKMPKLATNTNSFSISNYPNPFRNSTIIEYNLPEQGHVTLTVTNICGQALGTLVNTDQVEGLYKVKVDPADLNLQPGVYLYKIEVNGGTTNYNQVNKMIFTR